MHLKQVEGGGALSRFLEDVLRSWHRAVVSSLLVVVSGHTVALAAPDPGVSEQQRQQQREEALRKQQQVLPDVHLQPPAKLGPADRLPIDEQPCFGIQHIALEGADAERFQWALKAADVAARGETDPVAGRCVGAQGINVVITRIQNAIIERGFVTTRVMAPQQNLSGGTLRLAVVAGRVHALRLAPGVSVSRATLWNALPVKSGDILNLRDVEQGLENLERVPTAQADVQIVPAEGADAKPGESDLLVRWTQDKVFRVTASVDDSGSKTTGKYQGSVTLSYDNWWTLNDLFYVNIGHDLGGAMQETMAHIASPCITRFRLAIGCLPGTPVTAPITRLWQVPARPMCTAATPATAIFASPDWSTAMPFTSSPSRCEGGRALPVISLTTLRSRSSVARWLAGSWPYRTKRRLPRQPWMPIWPIAMEPVRKALCPHLKRPLVRAHPAPGW